MKRGSLAVQEVAEAAAALALLSRRGLDAALGRLDEHPALTAERHLHRLARALADEVLELHVGLDRRRDALRPRDRGLRVGERRRARDVEQDRSEEHTSELQSRQYLVCRLLLEK